MKKFLARLACWWHGHSDVPVLEPQRIFLQCAICQRVTPGWILDTPRPMPCDRKLLRFKKRLSKVA